MMIDWTNEGHMTVGHGEPAAQGVVKIELSSAPEQTVGEP
jgi:hypothetical protein